MTQAAAVLGDLGRSGKVRNANVIRNDPLRGNVAASEHFSKHYMLSPHQ